MARSKGLIGMGSAQSQFDALVTAHSADMFRYAYWLARERATAEDLVQEAFLRAWKSLHKLKETKAAKAWLVTILRREFLRNRGRYQLEITGDFDLAEMAGGRGEYDTSTEAFVLRRALAGLAEEYREPLVLQVLHGYSTDEIAQILELNQATVLTRLFRARKKMRALLEGEGPGEREQKP